MSFAPTDLRSGSNLVDLDELPDGRLQLYKLGIMSGIRKRMAITLASNKNKTDEKEEEEEQTGDGGGRQKREKRKSALEQNLGSVMGAGGGGGNAQQDNDRTKTSKKETNEPVCTHELSPHLALA